jgi:hypothetical protein
LAPLEESKVTTALFKIINCVLVCAVYSVVAWYSCCNISEPVSEIMIRWHITLISFYVFPTVPKIFFSTDYELVRLPEDATLCGFTPLMYNDQEPIYTSKETDMVSFRVAASLKRVLFKVVISSP